MEIENTPLRPEAGASISGKSLLLDIVKPLSGYLNGYAENSKRYAKIIRAEVTQRSGHFAHKIRLISRSLSAYCAWCKYSHHNRAAANRAVFAYIHSERGTGELPGKAKVQPGRLERRGDVSAFGLLSRQQISAERGRLIIATFARKEAGLPQVYFLQRKRNDAQPLPALSCIKPQEVNVVRSATNG